MTRSFQRRNIAVLSALLGIGTLGQLWTQADISNHFIQVMKIAGNQSLFENRLQESLQRNHDLEVEIERLKSTRHTSRQQKIAVMFVGAPRTLSQIGVMTSHVVNVVGALGAGGRDVVDVFLHLNVGTNDGNYASRNFQNETMARFTEEVLGSVVSLLSPVEVTLHADSSCSGLNGSLESHPCCTYDWKDANYEYNFLQFAYLRESYRSVKLSEKSRNISYDWFVRMRPDVGCFEPLPAARSLSTRRYYLMTKERMLHRNTNDYIFVVPRQLSDAFFEKQIMSIFEESCPKGVSEWPAEQIMFQRDPNLPYQALPLACVHVTGPFSAECHRFTRWSQRWIPSTYDLDDSRFAQNQTFEEGCNRIVESGYFGDQNHIVGEVESLDL